MTAKKGTMLEHVRRAKTLAYMPVVDFHSHLGCSGGWYYVPDHRPDQVIGYMDRIGINHIVAFTINVSSDVETGNEYHYRASAQYPGRISALSELHAGYPQDWLPILKNGHRNGSRGIKLIAAYQAAGPEDKIDWSPALDFARDKSWVVLNHSWGHERLTWYAGNFPTVTFIVGHSDGETGALCEKYDNVYQSTCASFVVCYCASVEQLYRSHPLAKIFFGTDCLDLDFCTAIGELAYANIPERAKEKIAGANAASLMKKLGWKIPALTC